MWVEIRKIIPVEMKFDPDRGSEKKLKLLK